MYASGTVRIVEADDKALGAIIRRRRAAAGMSQKDMSERLGLAQVVYGRIELGTRAVRAIELRDIAAALRCMPVDTNTTPGTPQFPVS